MSGTSIIRKEFRIDKEEKCRPCSNEYLNRGLISVLNLISNTLIKNVRRRPGKERKEKRRVVSKMCHNLITCAIFYTNMLELVEYNRFNKLIIKTSK